MTGALRNGFDTAALVAPVPAGAARAEAEQRLREPGEGGPASTVAGAVFRVVVLVVGAWALAVLFVLVVQGVSGGSGLQPSTVVIGALMVAPLAIVQVRGISAGRRTAETDGYRLRRFAAANGLTHAVREREPRRAAALFRVGGNRVASDVVSGPQPRPFEAANYDFETWAARTRMPHAAAYVRFPLVGPLPDFVLISGSADGAASWTPPGEYRQLDPGASAAARFRVLCAPGQEKAVRELLDGPAGQALLRVATDVDVEFVGGEAFFLARRHLPIAEPAFWDWTQELVLVLGGVDGAPGDPTAISLDPADDERRRALFRRPPVGRPFLIGCLLPLVVGVLAAIASVQWS